MMGVLAQGDALNFEDIVVAVDRRQRSGKINIEGQER